MVTGWAAGAARVSTGFAERVVRLDAACLRTEADWAAPEGTAIFFSETRFDAIYTISPTDQKLFFYFSECLSANASKVSIYCIMPRCF
ncbi:MAG TPA: hypothetical protein VNY05_35535 [Candidatus Acidoferrales bacterium]|nr:hypothetical protein [Candidatus Acidoferrales bacterium]